MFLVIFIRIEDTGLNQAASPSADQFVVTNNGQTYTHTIYFDTSVLTQDEINYYTANYNALPYQWIREIGQQKRDYAFLTGLITSSGRTGRQRIMSRPVQPSFSIPTARAIPSGRGAAMPLTGT